MFKNCSALAEIEVHLTDWGSSDNASNWMLNVPASGTFKCPSNLDDTRGANRIPYGWTSLLTLKVLINTFTKKLAKLSVKFGTSMNVCISL